MAMADSLKISEKLRRRINQEVTIREHISWIGQPEPWFLTNRTILEGTAGLVTIIVLLKTQLDVFEGNLLNLIENIPGLFMFSLPAIWGVWMLSSPFREGFKAARTVYVITDRRALSIEDGIITRVRIFPPAQLKSLERKEKVTGLVDLVITSRPRRSLWNPDNWSEREDVGFNNLRDYKEAEQLLLRLAHENIEDEVVQ